MSSTLIDTLFNGTITVRQDKVGYRFAVDAVLLAGHVKPKPNDTIVDLGTGCGVIPLILSQRYSGIQIYGVELQRQLADLACQNVQDNRLTDRIKIINQDMTTLTRRQLGRSICQVISNPPYREVGASRLNPNRQRALARHELAVTLSGVIETAVRLLKPSGRFMCIYPAERLTDLISLMRTTGLEPGFCRAVYPRPGIDAKWVIVEGVKGGRQGVNIVPPLMIMDSEGNYTEEMASMFR